MKNKTSIFTLPNGLTLIHTLAQGKVAHCGILIKAGTRDELPVEGGLAHFLEHCIFKGTTHRKGYHILNRLEVVGGELNAYTTKEETAIYASVQRADIKRAIELIADLCIHPTFPEKEIEKEKDVVLEEINGYKDSPSDQLFDDFESAIFEHHPLGLNILGTEDSVKSFSSNSLRTFHSRYYHPDNAVFSYVGPGSAEKIQKLVSLYFSMWNGTTAQKTTPTLTPIKAFSIEKKEDTHQAHFMIGTRAYSQYHPSRTAFSLLNNYLGGPTLNSRLNLSVREKYGLAYQVDSFFQAYSDAGLFQIYAATDKAQLPKTEKLITKELKNLRENKLSVLKLHQLKKQVLGQLALASEHKSSTMISQGKSWMHHQKIETDEEIAKRVQLISSEDLLAVANEIFQDHELSKMVIL
ncbi:MAG: M16 family metallopeptidase [Luteibaculaceae bacterium]